MLLSNENVVLLGAYASNGSIYIAALMMLSQKISCVSELNAH